jgi:hypothetical protein
VFADAQTGVTIWERSGAFPRAFLATEARVIEDPAAALAALPQIADLRREVAIDSGPALRGPSAVAAGNLIQLRVSPNRVFVRYEAGAAGILTLTDSYAPGWTATVNDVPAHIYRVNGVFRGVKLPSAGTHVVEFVYRPPTWALSTALAVSAFIALALLSTSRTRA